MNKILNYLKITNLLLIIFVLFGSGCVKRIALKKVTDALTGGNSTVFTGDNDPKLIEDALPFLLKMYETLLQHDPGNEKLLTTTASLFTLYAFAFVDMPTDYIPPEQKIKIENYETRAKKLLTRGRDYALRALEQSYPGITKELLHGNGDSVLALTATKDTTALYWAGLAWTGAVTTGKPGLKTLFTLPRAAKLVKRVEALNSEFNNGAVHTFYISYYSTIPKGMGGSLVKARDHFEKAVALSQGVTAAPFVALAEQVAVKEGNEEEFTAMLKKALAIDTSIVDENRLTNTLYQKRARWLLQNRKNYFNQK